MCPKSPNPAVNRTLNVGPLSPESLSTSARRTKCLNSDRAVSAVTKICRPNQPRPAFVLSSAPSAHHAPIPRSAESAPIAEASWSRAPVVPPTNSPTIRPQQSGSTTPQVVKRARNIITSASAKWRKRLCQGERKPRSSISEAQPGSRADLREKPRRPVNSDVRH